MIQNNSCVPTRLIQLAAQAAIDAYEDNIDLGTTEFKQSVVSYKGAPYQVLAIPGTNEPLDWFENFNMESESNMKKSAVKAARKIQAIFGRVKDIPLVVTGHSKGSAEAIAYKRLFGADYCIAFCPARSCVGNIKMDNTVLIIDKDDVIPDLGRMFYNHPLCDVVYLPNDHFGISIKDHSMESVIKHFS